MAKFRAKARAVDHLGKGQIADLPTAISELWKNGYDAYADNVCCDLFLEGYKGLASPFFSLSDDGIGMSNNDLLEKWIILGTDSKARADNHLGEEERLGKEPRVPLGEKGIGRLSVAYLGSPLLMITKKKDCNPQVLFMDWRVLENYNLYLDDIDFPISEIYPNRNETITDVFERIVQEFKTNITNHDWHEHQVLNDAICKSLTDISIPAFWVEDHFSNFLKNDYHGTTFIIFEPHPHLSEISIEGATWTSETDSTVNYLRTSLHGITNIFLGEEQPVQASFNIHSDTGYYDLISKAQFFCRNDMFSADHWLSGEFNEYGEFKGRLQVFHQNYELYFRPTRKPGITPYGPLKIEFGTLEGNPNSSKLPREQYDIFRKKTNNFGGIYLYRDGFRVLPYGRLEYDWLEFEERRSRGAGYYHFSHRRFIGYIGISRENNPKLVDKAGREGFIVNQAYKELRKDLIEFFTDLSVRYFRFTKSEEEPTSRQLQLKDIEAKNKRYLDAEKEKSKKTKKQFRENLKNNVDKIVGLQVEAEKLYYFLEKEKSKPKVVYNEVTKLIEEVSNNRKLLKGLRLTKPPRVSFAKEKSLKQKFSDYTERLENAMAMAEKCDALIEELQVHLSPEDFAEEFNKRLEKYKGSLKNRLENYSKKLVKSIDPLRQKISLDISGLPGEFAHETGVLKNFPQEDIGYGQLLSKLDKIYDEYDDAINNKYAPLLTHLENLDVDINDDVLVGWYKEQNEKINEKVEAFQELAQLGMAIEIIDHQFNVLYAEMDQAVRFFKQLSIKSPEIETHYQQLNHAFEHLETNHQLLTPLYRTTRRSRVEITGKEIKEYLENFFDVRFKRHRIEFSTNAAFDEYTFYTYESVLKPVFINIINNSLYWLAAVGKKTIKIIFEDGKILICNSGPKIGKEFLEDVFKLFFTRRPGGRGIGLHLAKTNLHTIGFDIFATEDKKLNKLNGACMVIVPPQEDDHVV